MNSMEAKRVMNGKYADLYIDGDLMAEATAFKAEVTLTKEEVKNYLTIKNVSDSSEETSIDVAVGNVLDDGAYTFIIKCNGTWQEGCGYRLELSDDRLYFTGYDQTIREYDFTVYKPDVTNVNLRGHS